MWRRWKGKAIDVHGAQPGSQDFSRPKADTKSRTNAALCSGAERAMFANAIAANELRLGKEKVKDKRKLIFPILYEAGKIQMWIVFKSGCGSLPQVTVSQAHGASRCVANEL